MNCFRYTLHCNRYKCLETKNKKEYNDDGFTQSGVRHETVKRTKTNGALSTIDAMATKTELRAMKNQMVMLSSKVHRKKRMYPTKRQTQSQRPGLSTEKCNCQISILIWKDTYFYLDARYTNLHHTGQPYIPPTAKKLGSSEISDRQAFILQQLSIMGVQKSKISSILNAMDDGVGSFSVQTVKNYLNTCDLPKRKEPGLDNHMSSAEAAIKHLHRRGRCFCFYACSVFL